MHQTGNEVEEFASNNYLPCYYCLSRFGIRNVHHNKWVRELALLRSMQDKSNREGSQEKCQKHEKEECLNTFLCPQATSLWMGRKIHAVHLTLFCQKACVHLSLLCKTSCPFSLQVSNAFCSFSVLGRCHGATVFLT